MNKKIITLSIVTAIIIIVLLPSTVSAEKTTDQDGNSFSNFQLAQDVEINCDMEALKEPIMPRGEPIDIALNISYSISQGGIIGLMPKIALLLQSGKTVNVKLEIFDKPDWCEVSLVTNEIPFNVNDEKQTTSVTMTIIADENAPAYQQGTITINASVEPIKGPLGLLTVVNGFKKQYHIIVTPGYLPIIDVDVQGPQSLQISPYNETKIPINITNYGNGLTTVFIDVVNSSDSFNVSIAEKINLEPFGDNTTVYLSVTADHNFDVENIVLKFTPARAQDLNEKGLSEIVTLLLENDGSYVEKDEGIKIDIDPTILTLVIIIILLIIINIYLLMRKKQ